MWKAEKLQGNPKLRCWSLDACTLITQKVDFPIFQTDLFKKAKNDSVFISQRYHQVSEKIDF